MVCVFAGGRRHCNALPVPCRENLSVNVSLESAQSIKKAPDCEARGPFLKCHDQRGVGPREAIHSRTRSITFVNVARSLKPEELAFR